MSRRLLDMALMLLCGMAIPAFAQNAPIKLIHVNELSGDGATVGTNFKNGADLAVAEINAKGGILVSQRKRARNGILTL